MNFSKDRHNLLVLKNLINRVEKKNQEIILFSAVDLKLFRSLSCPEIYGRQT